MSILTDFIEIEEQINAVHEKMAPLEEEYKNLSRHKDDINLNMSIKDRRFIAECLWDNLSDDEKEKINAHRKNVSDMLNGQSSYYTIYNAFFDPMFDDWHLVTFQRDGNKVRFEVSCNKNEGSISGLMTFLDPHWTRWIDMSELKSSE